VYSPGSSTARADAGLKCQADTQAERDKICRLERDHSSDRPTLRQAHRQLLPLLEQGLGVVRTPDRLLVSLAELVGVDVDERPHRVRLLPAALEARVELLVAPAGRGHVQDELVRVLGLQPVAAAVTAAGGDKLFCGFALDATHFWIGGARGLVLAHG
jgi:hypothetical protein